MRAVRRQLGFTLLELLVAISLTAIVLMVLMTGMRLAEGAWQRGTARLGMIDQALAENEAIQIQMSSAVPRLITAQYQQRQVQLLNFRGDAKQARFLSYRSWAGVRNSGLWLVNYRVAQAPDRKEQLYVSETNLTGEQQMLKFLLSDGPQADPRYPFGESADQIEISYMRPAAPGIPAAWVQEWKCEEKKQLPRGVRIHWQSGKQDRELLLVIPVREAIQ